jgi:phenylacetate-CoA ligase
VTVQVFATLSSLAARVKRSEWANRAVRYAFGDNKEVRQVIDRMSSPGAEEREAIQQELTKRVLMAAGRTSYGRARPLDLGAWPVLDKAVVRERLEDFLLPVRFKVPAATGGSTGQPMRLWRGLTNITAEQTFLDEVAGLGGVRFRDARVAVLRGDVPKRAADGSIPNYERVGRQRLVMAAGNLSGATLGDYLSALRLFSPDILWVYPTAGDALASLCLDRGLRLPVRIVISSSEMLSEVAMQRMQEVFGGTVANYYGQAERVCMAVSTRPGRSFFLPAYGLVELMPIAGQSNAGENRVARVVATGFWNDVMPLVRYDTGDLLEYDATYGDDELRLVGLGVLPFVRIVGRPSEYLLTPSGGRVQALNTIVREIREVRRAQFYQHENLMVEIRVVPAPDFGDPSARRLMAIARTKIPEEIPIEIRLVDRLYALPSGKTPFVIRHESLG